jgi:hypothetical protein
MSDQHFYMIVIGILIVSIIILCIITAKGKEKVKTTSEQFTTPTRTNDDLDQCGVFTTTITKLYPGICDQMFKSPDNEKCKNVINATIATENDVKNDDVRFVTNKLWDVFSGYNQWCNDSKPNEQVFFEYIKTL